MLANKLLERNDFCQDLDPKFTNDLEFEKHNKIWWVLADYTFMKRCIKNLYTDQDSMDKEYKLFIGTHIFKHQASLITDFPGSIFIGVLPVDEKVDSMVYFKARKHNMVSNTEFKTTLKNTYDTIKTNTLTFISNNYPDADKGMVDVRNPMNGDMTLNLVESIPVGEDPSWYAICVVIKT